MGLLIDAVNSEIEQQRTEAERQPPPLSPGAPADGPRRLAPFEEAGIRARAWEGTKDFLRTIFTPISMTLEGIERTDTATRGVILTAVGRIPAKDFPKFWHDSWSGKVKLPGREFNRLLLGQEMMDAMEGVKILPEWAKALSNPEPHLAGIKPQQKKGSGLDLADLTGFFSEVTVSPFTAFSFLPVNAFRATAAGRAAGAVFGPVERTLTFPLRKVADIAFNPRHEIPLISFINRQLDPQHFYMNKPHVAIDLEEDMARIAKFEMEWFGDSRNPGHLGLLARRWDDIIKRESPAASRVGRAITGRGGMSALTPDELRLVDEIKPLLNDLRFRAHEMGYDRIKVLGARHPVVSWDDGDLLEKFWPALIGQPHLMTQAIGEKTIAKRGSVFLPFIADHAQANKLLASAPDSAFDIWHILSQFTGRVGEKLVFDARVRTSVPRARSRVIKDALGVSRTIRDTVEVTKWEPKGWLAKYAPMYGWRQGDPVPGGKKALKGFNASEFHYTMWKANDLTGNARGRHVLLEGLLGEKFFSSIAEGITNKAQHSRVVSYFWNKTKKLVNPAVGYDFPHFSRVQNISRALTGNVVTATLGMNLGFMLHNTSQLLTTAAAHGTPAMLRGLFRQFDFWSEKGRLLRELRGEAQLTSAGLKRIAHEFTWQQRTGRSFHDIVMAPGMVTENMSRGVTSTVAAGEFMEQMGIKSWKDLQTAIRRSQQQGAEWIHKEKLLAFMRRESNDANFVYGLGGRSSLMGSPVAQMAFSLQSYSWKMAQFIGRQWRRDGSGVIRLAALHGWALNIADKLAGVNAENWLGWGFLPPNTLGRGPQVETLWNLVQYTMASAEGDRDAMNASLDRVNGNIREIFRMFGNEDVPGSVAAGLNAAIMSGFLPFPVVGVARSAKAWNEYWTGERHFKDGTFFRPVTPEEAMKSWFFTSHESYNEAQLRTMERRAKTQVDSEVDRRVDRIIRAATKSDGENLNQLALAAFFPISIRLGTGLPPAMWFLDGDGTSFTPSARMILSRLESRVTGRTVARPVLDMLQAGWLQQVLLGQYVNATLPYVQSGFVRPLKETK